MQAFSFPSLGRRICRCVLFSLFWFPFRGVIAQGLTDPPVPAPAVSQQIAELLDRSAEVIFADPKAGLAYAESAVEMARQAGSRSQAAVGLSRMGFAQLRLDDLARAEVSFGEAMALFEQIGDSAQLTKATLQLASVALARRDSVTAANLYARADRMARQIGDSVQQATVFSAWGAFLAQMGDFLRAKGKLQASLAILPEGPENARTRMAALGNLAGLYIQEGNFDSAAVFGLESARVCQEVGDTQTLGMQYTNIARLFIRAGDLDKALEYAQMAEATWSEMDFGRGLAQVQVILGRIYRQKGDAAAALAHAREGVRRYRELGVEEPLYVEGLLYWGDALRAQERYAEALRRYEEAAEVNRRVKDRFQGVQIALGRGELYNQGGDFARAVTVLEAAESEVRLVGSTLQLLELWQLQVRAYEGTGKYRQALDRARQARAMNDSIFQAEKLRAVEALQLEFDVAEKDRIAEEAKLKAAASDLEKELVGQRLQTTVIGGLVLLAVLLGLGLWYRYRMQTRARQLELEKQVSEASLRRKELEEENLRIRYAQLERQALQAQMNPHFLFNSLASLQNHILSGDLAQAEHFLLRFSRLVRNVLHASRHSAISVAAAVEILSDYLGMEQLRFGQRLDYEIRFSEDLETELIYIPPMLIQPYVENAIVHGIAPRGGQGHISIDIREAPENFIQVQVEDNGVGRVESARQQTQQGHRGNGLGTRITEERLELNLGGRKGTVEVFDLVDASGAARGTRVQLDIPISEEQ
ncbi:MAG: tetratricopeptide repeat protein [Bacteroidota bacterium]